MKRFRGGEDEKVSQDLYATDDVKHAADKLQAWVKNNGNDIPSSLSDTLNSFFDSVNELSSGPRQMNPQVIVQSSYSNRYCDFETHAILSLEDYARVIVHDGVRIFFSNAGKHSQQCIDADDFEVDWYTEGRFDLSHSEDCAYDWEQAECTCKDSDDCVFTKKHTLIDEKNNEKDLTLMEWIYGDRPDGGWDVDNEPVPWPSKYL